MPPRPWYTVRKRVEEKYRRQKPRSPNRWDRCTRSNTTLNTDFFTESKGNLVLKSIDASFTTILSVPEQNVLWHTSRKTAEVERRWVFPDQAGLKLYICPFKQMLCHELSWCFVIDKLVLLCNNSINICLFFFCFRYPLSFISSAFFMSLNTTVWRTRIPEP